MSNPYANPNDANHPSAPLSPEAKRTRRDEAIQAFAVQAGRLPAGDRGELRRYCGTELDAAPNAALLVFYRLVGRKDEIYLQDEPVYWLVATLMACYPERAAETASGRQAGNLGDSLRQAGIKETVVRRLLDGRREELPGLLHPLIRRMAAARPHAVAINWPQLLRDLLLWEHPYQVVQRRWARSYATGWEAAGEAPGLALGFRH